MPPTQNIPCPDAQLPPPVGFGVAAWNTEQYLNIWVCSMEAIGGIAMLPQFRFGTINIAGNTYQRSEFDGFVIDYRTVGINGGYPPFNKGRVATHEAGHWLGLWHTFQGNCFVLGDEVGDTPPAHVAPSLCPFFPNLDECSPNSPGTMFMNYMDYTQDACKYMFTEGQKTRARSFFAENGPYGTRFPFLENYFGIKHFPSLPYVVSNNTITVYIDNPACIDVTYSYTGPVTEVNHDNHQITFSVACPSSGTVSLTANAANYTDSYIFDFQNSVCTGAWPKLFEGKAFCGLLKDNIGNIFAWLGSVYSFTTNVNHIGPIPPVSSAGSYAIQYNSLGITTWVKPDMYPNFVLNSGDVQVIDQLTFTFPFYNGVTGNNVPPPPPLTVNERIIAQSNSDGFITATINGGGDQIHSLNSTIPLNGAIVKSFFNPATDRLFLITVNGSIFTFRCYQLSAGVLTLLPNQSSFSNDAYPITVDNSERLYMIRNNMLQEYLYNNPVPSFVPVSIPGFNNTSIVPPNTSVINNKISDKCIVINNSERNIYYIDFSLLLSKKIHFTFDPFTDIILQDFLIEGDNIYISGSVNTTGSIGAHTISFLGITPFESTLFLAKLSLQGDFSFRMEEKMQSIITEDSFRINLFPNPVSHSIRIVIDENANVKGSVYALSVLDQMKNKVLKFDHYMSGDRVNISSLRSGVYYAEVINAKGERSSKSFIKL